MRTRRQLPAVTLVCAAVMSAGACGDDVGDTSASSGPITAQPTRVTASLPSPSSAPPPTTAVPSTVATTSESTVPKPVVLNTSDPAGMARALGVADVSLLGASKLVGDPFTDTTLTLVLDVRTELASPEPGRSDEGSHRLVLAVGPAGGSTWTVVSELDVIVPTLHRLSLANEACRRADAVDPTLVAVLSPPATGSITDGRWPATRAWQVTDGHATQIDAAGLTCEMTGE
jgi:hypothetical protein